MAACGCIVPAVTDLPFHRCRGGEMCLVCGSARDNEFWGCEYCIALKPRLDPKWKDGRTDFVEPEFFVPYKI